MLSGRSQIFWSPSHLIRSQAARYSQRLWARNDRCYRAGGLMFSGRYSYPGKPTTCSGIAVRSWSPDDAQSHAPLRVEKWLRPVVPLGRNRVVPFRRYQGGPVTRNPALTFCRSPLCRWPIRLSPHPRERIDQVVNGFALLRHVATVPVPGFGVESHM
jgi:hypothetical protein